MGILSDFVCLDRIVKNSLTILIISLLWSVFSENRDNFTCQCNEKANPRGFCSSLDKTCANNSQIPLQYSELKLSTNDSSALQAKTFASLPKYVLKSPSDFSARQLYEHNRAEREFRGCIIFHIFVFLYCIYFRDKFQSRPTVLLYYEKILKIETIIGWDTREVRRDLRQIVPHLRTLGHSFIRLDLVIDVLLCTQWWVIESHTKGEFSLFHMLARLFTYFVDNSWQLLVADYSSTRFPRFLNCTNLTNSSYRKWPQNYHSVCHIQQNALNEALYGLLYVRLSVYLFLAIRKWLLKVSIAAIYNRAYACSACKRNQRGLHTCLKCSEVTNGQNCMITLDFYENWAVQQIMEKSSKTSVQQFEKDLWVLLEVVREHKLRENN